MHSYEAHQKRVKYLLASSYRPFLYACIKIMQIFYTFQCVTFRSMRLGLGMHSYT